MKPNCLYARVRGALSMLVLGCAIFAFGATAHAAVTIRIATVAPRGSVWMRALNKMKAEIEKQTAGEVKIVYYPGQVQGDERDVVRKMQTGQLDGGAFTAIGLAQINTQVLVLQMPGMFRDYARLDRARNALRAELEQTFLDKGYVLLGWGEVGKIHLFSKNPIPDMAALRKQKMWVWADDPVSKAMMRELGAAPRALGLAAVLPSLNTGMVNAVPNSPLGCTALQWHTQIKYMTSKPNSIGIGATAITKKIFDQIKPEHQKILKSVSEKYHRALLKRIRLDNERAVAKLQSEGVKLIEFNKADEPIFEKAARKVTKSFIGRYFSKELLAKVLKYR